MAYKEDLLTPPGRLVQGNPWELREKLDFTTKQPKLDKNGVQIHELFIALAIPKTNPAAAGWWEDQGYGGFFPKILAIAAAGYPNGETGQPGFAFKIDNGDDPSYATKIGFPGHWILKMSTMKPIQCIDEQGHQIAVQGQLKCGDYADVWVSVNADGHKVNPSIYLNPEIVRRLGYGDAIISGPDASVMGAAPAMPQGASAMPVSTAPMAAPPAAAAPVAPAPVPAPVATVASLAPAPVAAPVVVEPGAPGYDQYMQPGAQPAVPAAPANPTMPGVPPVVPG